MSRLSRAIRTGWQDQGGMTLVELMVSSTLSLIVGFIVFQSLSSFESIQGTTQTAFDSSAQVQLISNRLIQKLKLATIPQSSTSPFVFVSPSEVKLYISSTPLSPPYEADFKVTPDSGSNCPCTMVESDLSGTQQGQNLALSGITSMNVFSYYPEPTTTNLTPSPISVDQEGTTSASTLDAIFGIGVNLSTKVGVTGSAVSIYNFVELPNVYPLPS